MSHVTAGEPRRYRWLSWGVVLLAIGVCTGWAYREWSFSRQFDRAQQLLRAGDVELAQAELSACLQSRPDHPEVVFWNGRLARIQANFALASERYRYAAERGWVPELIDLERVLMRLQRGDLTTAGFLSLAVEKEHPDQTFILEILGPALFADFQLDQAAGLAKKWTILQPDRTASWLLMARIANKRQDRPVEQEAYREILARDPQNRIARLGLAESLLVQRQAGDALPYLESLVRDYPDDPKILLQMVKARRLVGEFDQALTIIERLLKDAPDSSDYLAERGMIALQDANPLDAEKWLTRAVAKPPFDTETLLNLALALERNGKPQEAARRREQYKLAEADLLRLRDVVREIISNPADVNLRREAGQIMLRNGMREEGKRWLNSALSINPNDALTRKLLDESP